jgi:hypothetical protein
MSPEKIAIAEAVMIVAIAAIGEQIEGHRHEQRRRHRRREAGQAQPTISP